MENSILVTLADGNSHPIAELAERHGVSVTQLDAWLNQLRKDGLTLTLDPRRNVRWTHACVPLQARRIEAALHGSTRRLLYRLDVFYSLDSTSQHLSRDGSESGQVCLAELQTHGRGRRGRRWVSPACANLYLSFTWIFHDPTTLDGLSLGVGALCAGALGKVTGLAIGLKWPNDLYLDDRKLGGVLIDLARQGTVTRAIIGIGINIAMTAHQPAIDQDWTQLAEFIKDAGQRRNEYAAVILDHLLPWLAAFPTLDPATIRTEWTRYDISRGRAVRIVSATESVTGIGAGIDDRYRFRLRDGDRYRLFNSGDVSLRLS
ncbi:MAG: biotin--[acetyl-CoA-carboxylase] ligase [Thiotrichales bacterium]